MTDCNNSSSNISGTPIAGTVTQVGSNLTIGPLVQTNHGFTAGNVIRFDVASNGYTLAQANTPANAEVCGVVSTTTSASVFSYVVEGDNPGEVFFLSGETAGVLDSIPPNDAGKVLKSVVVRLPSIPDGSGITQERGLVKNYVGNYLGGDTAIYMSGVNPIGSIHAFVGDTSTIPSGWAVCDGTPINATSYPNFSTAIDKRYGFRESLTFAANIPNGSIVEQGNVRAKIISQIGQTAIVEHVGFYDNSLTENVRGSVSGSQDVIVTTPPIINGFDVTQRVNVINGSQIFPNQTITVVTLDSVLTPDLRNKFIMGAPRGWL